MLCFGLINTERNIIVYRKWIQGYSTSAPWFFYPPLDCTTVCVCVYVCVSTNTGSGFYCMCFCSCLIGRYCSHWEVEVENDLEGCGKLALQLEALHSDSAHSAWRPTLSRGRTATVGSSCKEKQDMISMCNLLYNIWSSLMLICSPDRMMGKSRSWWCFSVVVVTLEFPSCLSKLVAGWLKEQGILREGKWGEAKLI